jgi:hypothetical protein
VDGNGNDWLNPDEERETVIENSSKLLMGKRKMLEDYFSLAFDNQGRVVSLPMVLSKYKIG